MSQSDSNLFLTAEWKWLAMLNYVVDRELLDPLVPPGTDLDGYQGRVYVSVVGFLFLKTRVKGLAVPFHQDFEELNLRFYVRRFSGGEWRRGVVFIKEIVPKPAATLYGPGFAQVLSRPPDCAFLAEGSPVNVYDGQRIVG